MKFNFLPILNLPHIYFLLSLIHTQSPPYNAADTLSGCPSISQHIWKISSLESLLPFNLLAASAPATMSDALDPSPREIGMLSTILSVKFESFFKTLQVFL